MTKTVRTPDACFDDLPDYDFAAHYVDIEGPELAQVVVDFVRAN